MVLLKGKIREAMDSCRRKLEWELQQNNMRKLWSGMKICLCRFSVTQVTVV